MCSSNVSSWRRDNFTSISFIYFARNLGKYLGFLLIKERITRLTFFEILGKVQTQLAMWKGKLLNRVDRIYLAKSIIASFPMHSMQDF